MNDIELKKITYFNNPWIRTFFALNDTLAFVPLDAKQLVFSKMSVVFEGIDIQPISIASSSIIGIYTVMNNNGIVMPNILEEKEKEIIKGIARKHDLNLYLSNTKWNGFGNNLVLNNKAGICSTKLSRTEINKISDVLGVELVPLDIAGYKTPGSIIIANDNGFGIHFRIEPDDYKSVEEILKVKGKRCTVNFGSGFVGIGVLHNGKSYMVGNTTTPFEMGAIEEALGFI